MRSMKIGKSGIEASVVGIGAWAIGGDSMWGKSDDAESVRTIHRARDLGVTLLDTAPAYGLGHSEEVVGRALKGIRDQVRVSTKAGLVWDTDEGAYFFEIDGYTVRRNISKSSLMKEVEDSLRRLDTDRIDVYITHWQSEPAFPTPIEETMEALLRLKEQGKILAIGVSNSTNEQLAEYLSFGTVDLIQDKYSILSRDNKTRFQPLLDAHDIVFQAYSPLESGLLTGKLGRDYVAAEGSARSGNPWFAKERFAAAQDMLDAWKPLCEKYDATPGQLAIAWTAALGDRVSVLCGARTVAQAQSNAKGGEIALTAEDAAFLTQAADAAIARAQ